MKCNICIPTSLSNVISEEFAASVGEDSFLEFECDTKDHQYYSYESDNHENVRKLKEIVEVYDGRFIISEFWAMILDDET